MKMFPGNKVGVVLAGVLTALVLAAPVHAASPQRLGSFAGAMKYCSDRYEEKEWSYKRARQRVAREVDDMSRRERRRAIEAGDQAYHSGRFMGKRLNRYECRSLLRQSEWRRFYRD